MIDTIVVDLPFPHYWPIFGGSTWSEDQEGQVVWRKEKHRRLLGSFDASSMIKTVFSTEAERDGWESVRFRSLGTYEYHYHRSAVASLAFSTSYRNWGMFGHELRTLRVEGSAAKFLQGHNLFGTDNLVPLVCLWAKSVIESYGLSVPKETLVRWERGDMKFHRVDVARMCDVGTDQGVADLMAALSYQSTFLHRGRGTMMNNGVQWGGRGSRGSVVKAYGKFREIHLPGHELPRDIQHVEWLKQYARGCVRFEVEFHSKELDKLGLRHGSAWHADTAERVYEDAMSKLSVTGQMPVPDAVYSTLPRHLQATYDKWLAGRDVRSTFANRQNFYKHRSALLAACNVDIAVPHSDTYRPKVVSLSKVIQPVPKSVPSWAYGTSLLAAA